MNNNVKISALNKYFSDDMSDKINKYKGIDEIDLLNESKSNVVNNFQKYASKIKAYVKFLSEHSINIDNIKNIDDFEKLPLITKDNYITKYKIEELVTDVSEVICITSSSGSTGDAFYWPKGILQDIDIAEKYEMLFESNFGIKNKKTLCIISLGLGVWSAGSFTITSAQLIAEKGYDFSFITPGLSIDENMKILKKFINSDYDQFIMVAYPSFIKDILESAIKENIEIAKKDIFILTGGEGITEEWRDYIYHLLGKKNNNKRIVSLFSTAESGVAAIETEFVNLIKTLFIGNNDLLKKLFKVDFIPTLMQYDPISKYLEMVNDHVVFSNFGVFTLIRYDTKDLGGILQKSELVKLLNLNNKVVQDSMNLPVVYIKGRSDIALTLYAVNIYIDNLKQITYSKVLLPYITGRFQSHVEYDSKQNQKFIIKLECNRNIKIDDEKEKYIKQYIISRLRELNSEYNKLYESVGEEKVSPIITFEEYSINNSFSHDKPKYKKIV